MSYDQEQALRDVLLEFKKEHRVWDTIYVEITNDKIKINNQRSGGQ